MWIGQRIGKRNADGPATDRGDRHRKGRGNRNYEAETRAQTMDEKPNDDETASCLVDCVGKVCALTDKGQTSPSRTLMIFSVRVQPDNTPYIPLYCRTSPDSVCNSILSL